MSASKIDLTPGSITPASTGKKSIQVNSGGAFVLVDDTGASTPISGVTDHPSLSNKNDPNQHNISSITNLTTTLSGKEDSLGNPVSNGMHLTSSTAGTRTWEAIPTPDTPNLFSARNEISQSFSTQSEIITEWNAEIIKHSAFTHSTATNPEEITINHTGFIQVWCKMNFEINVSNRVLFMTNISLDWNTVTESTAYAYARHQSYIDVATTGIVGVIIPVTSGQVLRVHSQIAYNDDVGTLGDQVNVNTMWGESMITISTIVEP